MHELGASGCGSAKLKIKTNALAGKRAARYGCPTYVESSFFFGLDEFLFWGRVVYLGGNATFLWCVILAHIGIMVPPSETDGSSPCNPTKNAA